MTRILAAAFCCLCFIATPALAGKTPSHTITAPVQMADEPAACDPYIFDYAVNYSITWAIQGKVTGWFVLTEPNIEAFITLWNNTHPDNMIPKDVVFDAVLGFMIPEGSDLGPAGEYIFLYNGGCFVVDIALPTPPANQSPPPAGAVKVQWKSVKQWEMFGYLGLA